MKIAINLSQYFKGKIGGLENYVRHVVPAIARRQRELGQALTIYVHESQASNALELAPLATILGFRHENRERLIREDIARRNYDVLFCPLLVVDPIDCGIPSVVMIPDLLHEFFPEYFERDILNWRRQNYRPSAMVASEVHTLSHSAKRTIVSRFGIDPSKVHVVYLDVDDEFKPMFGEENLPVDGPISLPKRFVYYPANFWPHKNHATLLEALVILRRDVDPALALVLTGSQDGWEEIRQKSYDLGLEHAVHFLGYQSRACVAQIYRRAAAIPFVSKFEGFGIPILEAFHAGIPVLIADVESCREIAGDAAIVADPDDPVSIAAGIERILEDPKLSASLAANGRVRAQAFSWDRTIELSLDRIYSVPESPSIGAVVTEYPLVSIVTPSYNMGRFLRETIESVLTQDYPHIEYMVFDGGSSDDTCDILRSYEGRLYFVSEPDGGQAAAINKGFAQSSGRIFTFLNADDTYLPGAVGTAVRHMLANPKPGVVYGEAYHVDESGMIMNRYPTFPFDYALLNRNCFICQPAAFMWRDVFDTAGWMNAEQHYALDYDLWARIAKSYTMEKIDDYLATSRLHSENKTIGSRAKVYQEIIAVVRAHFGYVPYDWLFGYSAFKFGSKGDIFERDRSTPTMLLHTLMLGCVVNRGQLGRFVREYSRSISFGLGWRNARAFTGQWHDGWVSRRFRQELTVPDGSKRVAIRGRHLMPFKTPLTIRFRLDGCRAVQVSLEEHGPFEVRFPVPQSLHGKHCWLEIDSDKTFVPARNGDTRALSCLIDSMSFES